MNGKIRTHGLFLQFLGININGNLIGLRSKCFMTKTDLIQGKPTAEGDNHVRILHEKIPRTPTQDAKISKVQGLICRKEICRTRRCQDGNAKCIDDAAKDLMTI